MKFSWSEINNHIMGNFDLFIASASYEERCLSLAQNIPHEKINRAVIFYLHDFEEYVATNLLRLEAVFKTNNISNELVELFHNKPIESSDRIIRCLDNYLLDGTVREVIIDITAFTHEISLLLFMLFKRRYTEVSVTFAYSNAADYDYVENEAYHSSDKWLSKGIGDIRSILGYPGDLLPTKKTHLIVIVGYEYDRALSVISDMEPTSLSLGFGKSASFTTEIQNDRGKHYGAREHFDEVVRDSMAVVPKSRTYTFDVSCNDPRQAYRDIKQHLEQTNASIKDKNIVLFAMNNKLSTLGVGLFALERDDIQLCYAPALLYNYSNYSMPGTNCYLFNLSE